jgi:hypothetical protein
MQNSSLLYILLAGNYLGRTYLFTYLLVCLFILLLSSLCFFHNN